MKRKLLAVLLAIVIVASSGCGYSESYVDKVKQEAYDEGYNDGYDQGTRKQLEKDCEEFIIDGRSIRDIASKVYAEYGITPDVAFSTYEQYNDDPIGSGITWEQYQEAIEAMYYASQIFPYCGWN